MSSREVQASIHRTGITDTKASLCAGAKDPNSGPHARVAAGPLPASDSSIFKCAELFGGKKKYDLS